MLETTQNQNLKDFIIKTPEDKKWFDVLDYLLPAHWQTIYYAAAEHLIQEKFEKFFELTGACAIVDKSKLDGFKKFDSRWNKMQDFIYKESVDYADTYDFVKLLANLKLTDLEQFKKIHIGTETKTQLGRLKPWVLSEVDDIDYMKRLAWLKITFPEVYGEIRIDERAWKNALPHIVNRYNRLKTVSDLAEFKLADSTKHIPNVNFESLQEQFIEYSKSITTYAPNLLEFARDLKILTAEKFEINDAGINFPKTELQMATEIPIPERRKF